jgi:hypothetical protein
VSISRFLANCIAYVIYICFFVGTLTFLQEYSSLTQLVNAFIAMDWRMKLDFLFFGSLSLFISIHFIVMHFYIFRFDATFGAFIKSRRRFKQFMIEHDKLSKKIVFWRFPWFKFGSMRNPFFRTGIYIAAVFAYERYRQFLITNPEDSALAKENYMNTKKAMHIENNNPIINRLLFDDRFAQYVSWPYTLTANILVYLGVFFAFVFLIWLLVYLFSFF